MYEEHAPNVYGIALMMTKSRALADDIAQEAFLRAFHKYHLYDPSKPLRQWLFKITLIDYQGKDERSSLCTIIPDCLCEKPRLCSESRKRHANPGFMPL
ncbi:RNA polymerase sigma factor [Paenibacillus sp. FSL H8-0034]|uniref:RNA polymerase sigma factor n=1 Tax=Paenibacillus sp. FSL H8-0034 TaxID=2954671 RepID=UPI0030FB8FEA